MDNRNSRDVLGCGCGIDKLMVLDEGFADFLKNIVDQKRYEQEMQMTEQVVRMFASKFGDAGDSDAVIEKNVALAVSYAEAMKGTLLNFEDILDQLFFMVDESDDLADVKKNVATAKAYVIEIDKQMREESVKARKAERLASLKAEQERIVSSIEEIKSVIGQLHQEHEKVVINLRKINVYDPSFNSLANTEREILFHLQRLQKALQDQTASLGKTLQAISYLHEKAPEPTKVDDKAEKLAGLKKGADGAEFLKQELAGEIVKKAEAIREVQNLRKNMTVDNPRFMEIVKQERELIEDIECLNEMLFENLSGANIIRSAIAILEGKAPVKAPVKARDEHKGGSFPGKMETVKPNIKKEEVCHTCPGGFRTTENAPAKAPAKKVVKAPAKAPVKKSK